MKQNLRFSLLLLFFALSGFSLFAQGQITGTVIDDESDEPLIGANVLVKGTTTGSITDVNGNFTISGVRTGNVVVIISFIGYDEKQMNVTVKEGQTASLGQIMMSPAAVGLDEVKVIASVAIDRKTPVAVSTIKADRIQTRIGNQEFPEVLRFTPSIYVTKSGGGFGDSRINVRGFDSQNTAVMINGVPVNDMENGVVYWSNWAGLTDVSSSVQVQRGLGASKLAVPSVGGSINIITNAAEMKQGGQVGLMAGNDGFQKYSAQYSTGLSDNGWAFTFQATHSRGNGYVDGTKFRAYSYFASLAKVINEDHTINATVLGAPQWHNQRSFANSYQDYQDYGIKYNSDWGYLDGEEFSIRKNFYHKPIAFINHYWTISDKTELATSLYGSWGRGGGTGDLGRINGTAYFLLPKTADHLVPIDNIKKWNMGGSVPAFGDNNEPRPDGEFVGEYVGESSSHGIIRRASMNEHNWYGLISNLTTELSDQLTLTAGIDARSYRGLHYRRVEDLLGLAAYLDKTDVNNPQHYVTDEGREDGNEIAYNDDGLVHWLGLYGQLEYSYNDLTAFISLSGSNQGFKRVDYFNYEDDDPAQESDWQNFLGGTVKAGLNYNLDAHNNVFVNGGYFSRQPIFDNVFPYFTNEVNDDTQNQQVKAVEVGYGYRSAGFRANLNLYHTQWGNRQFSTDIDGDNDGDKDETAIFNSVSELHQGIEVDFTYSPVRNLNINGMLSVGNWRYTDNFTAVVLDENQNVINSNVLLYMEDVKVGDAAQTTWSIGADYTFAQDKAKVYGTYYRADNVYARFDLGQFITEGNQVWKLPSYGLLDLGASYKFAFGDNELTIIGNVNNVLNEEYISESSTNNLTEDPSMTIPGTDNASVTNGVYYGFGTTWNLGVKFTF